MTHWLMMSREIISVFSKNHTVHAVDKAQSSRFLRQVCPVRMSGCQDHLTNGMGASDCYVTSVRIVHRPKKSLLEENP